MGNFEDQLWTELANAHGDELAGATRSPARRGRGRPIALTAGAFGVVGAATAVALTLTATTSPPAYAVTDNHDGTIAITMHDVVGITGANAELAKLGVPIRAVVADPACHDSPRLTPLRSTHGPAYQMAWMVATKPDDEIMVRPADIPAGVTLLLATQKVGSGAITRFSMVRGPVPNCLSVPRLTQIQSHVVH